MSISITDIIPESFTITEFQFGDKRIDKRANFMSEMMAKRCQKSLPEIFHNQADLKGAYRFFSNDMVTPKKILEPHSKTTITRCKKQKVVLAIQDSSDNAYDYMKCLEGFESLHNHVDKGFRIHPVLATTDQGTPLGILASFNYTRIDNKTKKHRNSLSIEEKESYRWLLGYREACKLVQLAPETLVVSIADREGDIYECFREATDTENGRKAELLVRAQHNRTLAETSDKAIDKIEKKLIRSPIFYETKVILNRYRKNEREANIVVRASEIVFKAPNTSRKKSLAPIKINAVLVTEVDPPEGEQGLHWLLLTTLLIDSIEEIRQIISFYAQRWSIEIFFKVLKSGCNIDSCRFQETNRIENFIAFAMIVAWKVMLTTYLPREYPEVSCTVLFTELEWKLAYKAAYNNKRPLPNKEITLKEAVMLVAMLGGYQKRKDPPGIQTVWKGVIRVMDMVYGYELTKEIMANMQVL
jgi:hypothetical protein